MEKFCMEKSKNGMFSRNGSKYVRVMNRNATILFKDAV